MDTTTGKIANALTKGVTDACSIGVDALDVPKPVKKFLNSMLTNVDDMVEEHLVLSKMKRDFDDESKHEAKAIEAPVTKRPDAESAVEPEVQTVEEAPEAENPPGQF